MNNQIQLVLKSSTTELSLNDHELGIYLVPELDGLTGLPEIRTTSGVNSGYDGGWTSAQHYDARSITIRGVIANTDVATVERLRKQLVSLAGQGKQEELTLDLVTEAGNAYTLQVRTIALEMAMKGVLEKQEFMLQLRADDPLIYDNAESTHEAYIQVSKATGGFTINFDLPLAITGGSEETVISNDGLEQVPTITRLYGELHNPKIINQTTNQSMQINADLGFSEGQWVDASEVVTGKTINIEDAPDNAPLASFQLDGETSQNGTPTPSAPVAVNTTTGENELRITGKNIAKLFSGSTSFSQSGATTNYTSSNGRIYITTDYPSSESSGAQIDVTSGHTQRWAYTANSAVNATDQHLTGDGGTYNFYISVSSGVSSGGGAPLVTAVIAIQDNSSSTVRVTEKYINLNNTPAPASATLTITLGEHEHIKCIGLYMQNVAATNSEIKVQLEKGSSASSFEPYQGQSYEINLGKNLLDMATLVPGYVNGSNGTITVSQTQGEMCSGFIKVEPSTKYTVSIAETSSTYAPWFGIGEYTAADTSTFIRRQANTTTPTSYTITTHSTAQYVRVSGRNFADATKIQFEKWPSPTDYAAYFDPIELCKIGDYQDYIYKSGGKWYVHKEVGKYTFKSSETVSYQSNFPRFMVNFSHGQNATAGVVSQAKSSHFVVGQTASVDGTFGIAANVIYLHNSAITSADGLKTWFGNNNVSVYFALATPTDTEITNATLITQLETLLNTARTYAGVNNIFTVTPNEQGTLEISYYTHKTADNRDEIVIDSRLRTVTLNGLDIYHLIETGSEFLMLAPGENKLSLQSDITGDNGYAEVSYKQGYLSI